jgi:hypothetical protein
MVSRAITINHYERTDDGGYNGSITEIDIPRNIESFDVGEILAAIRMANDVAHASRSPSSPSSQ